MIDDLLDRLKNHEQGNDVETHELLIEAHSQIIDLLDNLQWAMQYATHESSCTINQGEILDCSCGFSELLTKVEQ